MKSQFSQKYLAAGFGVGTVLALLIYLRTPLFRGESLTWMKGRSSRQLQDAGLLNKDDVLRVGKHTLSLGGYYNFRATMKERTRDEVLWVVKAAFLTLDGPSQPGFDVAVEVARYAEGHFPAAAAGKSLHAYFGEAQPLPTPEELRQRLSAQMTQSAISENSRVIAELR